MKPIIVRYDADPMELVKEKQQIEIHLENCCAAASGLCSRLDRYEQLRFLLGETEL